MVLWLHNECEDDDDGEDEDQDPVHLDAAVLPLPLVVHRAARVAEVEVSLLHPALAPPLAFS